MSKSNGCQRGVICRSQPTNNEQGFALFDSFLFGDDGGHNGDGGCYYSKTEAEFEDGCVPYVPCVPYLPAGQKY